MESNRDFLREVLKSTNLDVLMAENGREALDMAAEYNPALIIMDVRMPVMDGCEAAAKLKENIATRHIPVIALTASMEFGRQEAFENNIFEYCLVKPVQLNKLLAILSKYLECSKLDLHNNNRDEQVEVNFDSVVEKGKLLAILDKEILPEAANIKIFFSVATIVQLSETLAKLGNVCPEMR